MMDRPTIEYAGQHIPILGQTDAAILGRFRGLVKVAIGDKQWSG
jgi:hypothetical protein